LANNLDNVLQSLRDLRDFVDEIKDQRGGPDLNRLTNECQALIAGLQSDLIKAYRRFLPSRLSAQEWYRTSTSNNDLRSGGPFHPRCANVALGTEKAYENYIYDDLPRALRTLKDDLDEGNAAVKSHYDRAARANQACGCAKTCGGGGTPLPPKPLAPPIPLDHQNLFPPPSALTLGQAGRAPTGPCAPATRMVVASNGLQARTYCAPISPIRPISNI
jgi:hypothetical protein